MMHYKIKMSASATVLRFLTKTTLEISIKRTIQRCICGCTVRSNPKLIQSNGVDRRREKSSLAAPEPDNAEKQYPEHIKRLVEDISKLTILEVSELNQLLKTTLHIEDVPVMALGASPVAAQEGETQEPEKATEPTEFTVKLAGFDPSAKVKLIKEIKSLVPGMNLVQAKKFVESAPQIVREKTNKEEADIVKKALEAAGATVEIET